MREVIIKSWCDKCLAQGAREEAEQIDIMWNGAKYSLDLCRNHLEPYTLMDELITEFGQPVAVRRKKIEDDTQTREATFPCPECDRMFTSAQGVSAHKYQKHTVIIPLKCDVCDRTFTNAQGLGAHRRHGHNIPSAGLNLHVAR